MCWLGKHWWRYLAAQFDQWGVRACRICRSRERAMYDAATGVYWEKQ